ncbi:MAG: sigma-70 family RNA polymerase sigma factor [Thermoleophilia bacterium]
MREPSADELRRAAAGDERMLDDLVRAYYGPVYNYLYRLVGDAGEAEDLAQEVFLRMARRVGGFGGRARFSTWLFQIARNAGIDHLRRREAERARLPAVLEPLRSSRDAVGEYEEAQLVWSCIGTLNEDLRSALLLRDLLGFSYREIAEILESTLATVKWRIYAAREQVQERYRAVTAAEPGRAPGLPR